MGEFLLTTPRTDLGPLRNNDTGKTITTPQCRIIPHVTDANSRRLRMTVRNSFTRCAVADTAMIVADLFKTGEIILKVQVESPQRPWTPHSCYVAGPARSGPVPVDILREYIEGQQCQVAGPCPYSLQCILAADAFTRPCQGAPVTLHQMPRPVPHAPPKSLLHATDGVISPMLPQIVREHLGSFSLQDCRIVTTQLGLAPASSALMLSGKDEGYPQKHPGWPKDF